MRKLFSFLLPAYHYLWALISAIVFWFPSRNIRVIGVTGTKGKSTTLAILAHILKSSGRSVALLSSVDVIIGSSTKRNITGNTMPGRFFIQKFLRDAVRAKCDYALIEVTSQGVVQHRHRFIAWDDAGFLDIHPEHIESHGSFERYLKAKTKFFSYVARHGSKRPHFFVHDADEHANAFLAVIGSRPVHLFNINDVDHKHVPTSLQGEFNLINIAAALSIAHREGVAIEHAYRALESFSGIAGRMEHVQKKPFAVVVDYAHTPDSLEAVYKHFHPSAGSLICVLGSAGGGRDTWKRPQFGRIASQYCSTIVLTNEDPFDEDPQEIINQIKSGIDPKFSSQHVLEVLDRKEAIAKAIALSSSGGTVVITGKGSEEYIRVKGGKRIPWSDVDVVRELLHLPHPPSSHKESSN